MPPSGPTDGVHLSLAISFPSEEDRSASELIAFDDGFRLEADTQIFPGNAEWTTANGQ